MPTTAESAPSRIHSWDLAYFKSAGTLELIDFVNRRAGFQLKRPEAQSKNCLLLSEDRFGNHDSRKAFAPNLDLHRRPRIGKRGRHIPESYSQVERRALRATHDLADPRGVRTGTPDRIVRAGWSGLVRHFKSDALPGGARSLLL